jgi:phosphoserine phosphatase
MSNHESAASRPNLYLVRHGQTEWNVERRWQGHLGGPLSADGIMQADKIACELSQIPIGMVYCSDLERAVMTAERISAVCNAAIIKDERLREIRLGEWEGELDAELRRKHPLKFEERQRSPLTFRVPGGENLIEVRNRLRDWLADMLPSSHSHIVVVSHAVTLAVLRAEICGHPLQSAYHSHLANCEAFHCTIP